MQDQSVVVTSVPGEPQWDAATAWVRENQR